MTQTLGIDLGTTYSSIAVLASTGVPKILPNREGEDITPSVVMFSSLSGGDEPVVGTMAKHSAASDPHAVVQFVKRFIGDKNWQFDSPSGESYSAVEVSAIILKRLKEDAEMALGHTVTDVVVTVPAYFDDLRRTATKQAGEIAGLNVIRVLNEPTAAALAYGLDNPSEEGVVMVFDLGGGTFDATLLTLGGGKLDVLATDGDRNLGGFDFDNRIMEFVAEKISSGAGDDALDDPIVLSQLREKAEIAKRSLTTVNSAAIHLSILGKPYKVEITRGDFEAITSDLMQRAEDILGSVLESSGLTWPDVKKVLLVGGSSRMPMVSQLISKLTTAKIDKSIDPDRAVALGAAVQAAIEDLSKGASSQSSEFSVESFVTISDVTSQSLGTIVMGSKGEINSIIIERNSKVPSKNAKQYKTLYENQTEIQIQVTEGDDEDPEWVTILGEQILSIPPYPKGAPIRVIYAYDIDQTVFVEVEDLTTNKSLGTFQVERPENLSGEMVQLSKQRLNEITVS
jgi:molecular chaperone DnaK